MKRSETTVLQGQGPRQARHSQSQDFPVELTKTAPLPKTNKQTKKNNKPPRKENPNLVTIPLAVEAARQGATFLQTAISRDFPGWSRPCRLHSPRKRRHTARSREEQYWGEVRRCAVPRRSAPSRSFQAGLTKVTLWRGAPPLQDKSIRRFSSPFPKVFWMLARKGSSFTSHLHANQADTNTEQLHVVWL